jgi:4-amino-4-deoxy-L-arabinose transferase-like glycosyltransferase
MLLYMAQIGNPDTVAKPQPHWRDDDFYVDRPGDRATLASKTREILATYPLARTCLVIFFFAFMVRGAYNLHLGNYLISPELRDMHDYDQVARSILDGTGYSKPWAFTDDRGETVIEIRPTMFRPPLYTLSIAAAYGLANRNPLIARILLSTIGSITSVLVFLVARRLFAAGTALVAAVVAALHPSLVAADGVLYPESLFAMLLIALVLALSYLSQKPSVGRAAVVGVIIGAMALTRAEGAAWLILPVAVIAFGRLARSDSSSASFLPQLSRRLALCTVVCGIAFLVYLPWLHYTWSNFRTIASSTSLGSMMAGANNRTAYYDPIFVGSWYYGGIVQSRELLYEIRDPRHNEKTVDDLFLRRGMEYAKDHLERAPTVALARLARSLDLWDPNVTARLEEGWGRPRWVTYASSLSFYFLFAAALYAFVRLRSRWHELFPLAAIFAGYLVMSLSAFGTQRFRVIADPAVVVLAAPVLYGFTRADVIRRRVSLDEVLGHLEAELKETGPEVDIPPEVRRAMKLRAIREAARASVSSERLAALHEGEDLATKLGGVSADDIETDEVFEARTDTIRLTERAEMDLSGRVIKISPSAGDGEREATKQPEDTEQPEDSSR